MNKNNEYIAFNSYGGFNQTKDEYHILNTKTPLPWCNVMANENFGTIISTYGTVYTYFKNSSEFKITNWCNDWISFSPGESFKGIFDQDYNLVYGYGYTKVLQENDGILKTMDIFIPPNEDIKIQYIQLENTTDEQKTINIACTLDPVLGVAKETNTKYILCRQKDDILELKNPYSAEFSDCVAYMFATNLSQNNNQNVTLSNIDYSINVETVMLPHQKTNFALILGCYTKDTLNIVDIKNKYSSNDAILDAYSQTKKYWRQLVVRDFKLEDEYLNIMANGWLLYQTIVCRLYARSAFYQSGGAIGFRDQLQDSLALISGWPQKTREQIILHSSKQFEKGDVLHWWHSHNNTGIRTYFSDDYLWLPYVLSEYVESTKDTSILSVETKYIEDKSMGNKHELYDVFNNIDKTDSVYNHAKKTITYALSRISPKNGLLDIGDGDWNDGFSNIRGQSVWLTFFIMNILEKFKPLASFMQDIEMVKECEKMRHILKHSIISNTWDSDHFVRAFFENGDVLGANSNKECKIDLISQAWAAIAMKDYPDVQNEIHTALESTQKYLVDKENMIVKLLYPAFDKPRNNPGYIKAYVPGTRENGGQYTHAATWLAKAYFELGENEKGLEILKFINPIQHSDTKEKEDIYMVEPYVIAADVYSNNDHVGRGGWTWYTGSAAWMYKVIEDYVNKKK
ncbi:MAG: hypothetical protein RSB76_00580 [Clostridia bacterium]